MTWPTPPSSSALPSDQLDNVLDSPAGARDQLLQLKARVDELNAALVAVIGHGDPALITPGRLINIVVWDQAQAYAYTPSSSANNGRLLLVGGGGQGGGAAAGSSGQASVGSGGNSGCVADIWLFGLSAGTVQIGQRGEQTSGGLGGAGLNGVEGGNSVFATTNHTVTVGGGSGGRAGTATGTFPATTSAINSLRTISATGSVKWITSQQSVSGGYGLLLSSVLGSPGIGAAGYQAPANGQMWFTAGGGRRASSWGGGGDGAVATTIAQTGAEGFRGFGLLLEYA